MKTTDMAVDVHAIVIGKVDINLIKDEGGHRKDHTHKYSGIVIKPEFDPIKCCT
jgi:hypothetical protein